MSTLSHESAHSRETTSRLPEGLPVRELAASLAITVMWLAVLFDALFGPNIVNTSSGGGSSSVPSAVVVSLFAFLGTWAVARYALREPHTRP